MRATRDIETERFTGSRGALGSLELEIVGGNGADDIVETEGLRGGIELANRRNLTGSRTDARVSES